MHSDFRDYVVINSLSLSHNHTITEFRMTASDCVLESNNSDNMWSSSRTIDRNCGYASIHERLYMMSSDHILHGRQKRLRIKKESMDRAAKRNGRTPIHKGCISASDAIRLGARLYEEGLLAKQKREQMRIRIFEQREAELEAVAFA